jgi:hypothetical protein
MGNYFLFELPLDANCYQVSIQPPVIVKSSRIGWESNFIKYDNIFSFGVGPQISTKLTDRNYSLYKKIWFYAGFCTNFAKFCKVTIGIVAKHRRYFEALPNVVSFEQKNIQSRR